MILGVLSDTHGNLALMMRAAEAATEVLGAERLLHLGDNWADQEALACAGYAVTAVPGLWCPEYSSPAVLKARVDAFCGLKIAYAHDKKDLPALTRDIGLALTGHTHRACIDTYNGVPHLNPGHLKHAKDRGRPATFGLVRIENDALHLAVYDLSGNVCRAEACARTQPVGGQLL